ncbi:hypothetical protein COB57_03275 [Candidatus Peregrinibacteria bacterium]|nr:MAG: hypothetical protein COB57_03275 [Candidatus Peregrinibacteria bacterium]
MGKKIYIRHIMEKISKFLYTDDILILHGARQVGKTSILKHFIEEREKNEEKFFYIDLENLQYLELLEQGVDSFIDHLLQRGFHIKTEKVFVFIDEIQYLSNPSNFLKYLHDHYPFCKCIVSGSSSFEIKNKLQDSLVGRTMNFEIFPLSFSEKILFEDTSININKSLDSVTLEYVRKSYKEYVLYGGYPKIVLTKDIEMKEMYLQQIIDTYIRKDIKDLANIRDILKFNKLLRILSVQSGQMLNVQEIANTVGISRQTVEHYLFILESTYIIKRVYPYSNNIRSELFKTPKIFFYDTGLMHVLQSGTVPNLMSGESFETSFFSEIVKNMKKDQYNYWRTQDKKEIDFILPFSAGLLPIEVKINTAKLKTNAIDYFLKKYDLSQWLCVAMDHHKNKAEYVYPWETKKIFSK